MNTQLRNIIETEIAYGPMKTLADRLEIAIAGRIQAYCGAFRESSETLDERWAAKAILALQDGIIGVAPKAVPEQGGGDAA